MLVSILILGIAAGAGISCLANGNRAAESNRIRNAALAACQERIEQIVASPYSPPNTVPAYFGTWPVPASDTFAGTGTVQLCTDVNGGGTVTGTRTTVVALANPTLNLIRVTARISYQYRGKTYVCETYTLRSPD